MQSFLPIYLLIFECTNHILTLFQQSRLKTGAVQVLFNMLPFYL